MILTSIMARDTDRRELIRKRAIEGVQDVFPLKVRDYQVEVRNAGVVPRQYSSREQKEAILHGRTLQEPLKGDLVLRDRQGKALDVKKGVTLAQVPYFTPRHTFIVDGNEYTVSNQRRVRPGVYTRVRGNEELEATFNLAKGENFRVNMSPEKGHLYMEYGTSRIPLYPVLRGLGVSDKQIRQQWGGGVVDANKDAFDKKRDQAIKKLYERLVPAYNRTATTPESMVRAIEEAYQNTSMDGDVTKRTLGQSFSRVTPTAMLRASTKLLDVHRAGEDTDDRDSLAFQTLHGVEDFFKERIQLEGRTLARKMAVKASGQATPSLDRVVPASPFTRSLRSFITNAALSAIPSQINPVEILDSAVRITSLGEGGISSERAVPPEARNLHSTHFGIIDPVRTPECYDDQTEVFTKQGWKLWSEVTPEDRLACRIEGRLEFHVPRHLVARRYTGPLYGVKTGKIDYLVTPNHRVLCRTETKWHICRADAVHGTWNRWFDTGHSAYIGNRSETFHLPRIQGRCDNLFPAHGGRLSDNTITVDAISMQDWAAFMGWYLSEGNVTYDETSSSYFVDITQCPITNKLNHEMIEALLRRMPFRWCRCNRGRTFRIGVKQLAAYLRRFGYCYDKYIPDYLLVGPLAAREALFETLLLGDGRIDSKRKTGKRYKQRVFCTTSPRLAADFERLSISLGYATRTARYTDNREDRYLDTYEVRVLRARYRQAMRKNNVHRIVQYDGMVYCAEVPGNLLYVRRHNSVPIWCGNSFKVGVDLRGTIWTHRDENGRMFTKMRNARTGRVEFVPIHKLEESTIAFPHEMKRKAGVGALQRGYVRSVPKSAVDYEIIHPAQLYGPTTNLVPMPESLQGNRTIMGSKMATQALPLVGREAPHIQVESPKPGRSFEEEIADLVVPTAPVDGVIKKIDKDYVYIQPERTKNSEQRLFEQQHVDVEKTAAAPLVKVHYDHNYPLASKTYLHNNVQVKVGDRVQKGQHLADSNFTRDGSLALGRNMRVGYMAYYGANSNDAVVISEGASKKLTSEHMYKEVMSLDNDVVLDKKKHRAQFPNKWTAAQYGNLDDRGVATAGAVIQPGDPVVVALRRIEPTAEMAMLGKLHKTLARPFREEALTWNHKAPGKVVDVIVTTTRVVVTLKTEEPAGVGDKIAGRYGNKGVISKIIPDDQMVHTKDGRPVDILMTSAGIVSRVNPAQIIETAAAKVAEKTGKRIIVPSLSGRNNVAWAKKLLKDHDLSDKEVVHNPRTGKDIVGPDGKGVMVGPQYIYKLFKSTDTNYSARGVEDYDVNLQPAKGGEDGAKGLGRMEINALIAHNTRNVLQEASTLKSSRNDEFWRAYQLGRPLPKPKPSFAYDKLGMMLRGAGIKFDKSNEQVTLGPMTDADIKKLSSGAITKATMIRERDLNPERGGLFDPVITGGTQGNRWSHVDLKEPIVNPTFEEPTRRLLGLTQADFRKAIATEGGGGIRRRLKQLDVSAKEQELREQVRTAKGSQLDSAVKQLKYLKALKAEGLRPDEAYVLTKLPVVPPVARPIMPSRGKRDLLVSDANYLYRDNMLANDALADMKQTELPDEIGRARLHLYDTTRATFGLADPVSPQLQGRKARGFITTIAGQGSPKHGFFHGKLLRLPQDLSGRGTAVPDLALNMDQIGLPEEMMWKTFQPHVIRSLVQKGYKAVDAQRMVEERHPVARDALVTESKQRPVLVNRAPTLHRYGIIGAYATPVPGKTIRVNPFIETGMNLDYDGDQQINTVIYAIPTTRYNKLDYHYRGAKLSDMYIKKAAIFLQDHTIFFANLADTPHEELLSVKGHIEFYAAAEGLKTLALNEATNTLTWQPVRGWSRHSNQCVELVTLSSGKQLVTDDDPRAVYGIDIDTLTWCRRRPSEAMRQMVPVMAALPEPPTQTHDIPHPFASLKAPFLLNEDTGYFIGATVGDGWVSYADDTPKQVCLANSDDATITRWLDTANTVLIADARLSRTDCNEGKLGSSTGTPRYTLSRIDLARFLSPRIGRGAANKHLPAETFTAPLEFRWGVLSGLWDTDGSVAFVKAKAKNKQQFLCNYSTTSLRLAQELKLLWTSVGVTATITPSKTPKDEPCWQLNVSTVELHRSGQLHLANPRKVDILQKFMDGPVPDSTTAYSRNKYVPLPAWLATWLMRQFPQKTCSSVYSTLAQGRKRGYITKRQARQILSTLTTTFDHPKYATWCTLVTADDYNFEYVKHVEKTDIIETGYDLTVPGYETFTSYDGIVLSNTLQIHVPVSDKAVNEVKGTTMSNLLFGDRTKSDLMVMPQHEAVLGVYAASAAKGGKTHRFKTKQEAVEAYRRGDVELHDSVQIG